MYAIVGGEQWPGVDSEEDVSEQEASEQDMYSIVKPTSGGRSPLNDGLLESQRHFGIGANQADYTGIGQGRAADP